MEVRYVKWNAWCFRWGASYGYGLFLAVVMTLWAGGCHDRVELPSADRLLAFEQAGPTSLAVDMDRVVRAKVPTGPYRVNCGDVLTMQLPMALYPDMLSAEEVAGGSVTHTCRISEEGMIILPDGRQISVVEKPVGEIEADIVDAYYPALVKTRPSVYVNVLEYRTYRLQIAGAITTPGVYQLRHDQMSLVSLLMEAGGITETGAACIRIERANETPAKSVRQAVAHLSSMSEAADRTVDSAGTPGGSPGGAGVKSRRGIGVQFDPEGPLVTTGWLRVSKGDAVIVHEWLDIMSDLQRSTVLRKAAGHITSEAIAQLQRRLWSLGQLLESRAEQMVDKAPSTTLVSGWRRMDGGQYTTFAVLQETDERASDYWGQSEFRNAPQGDRGQPSETVERKDTDTTVIMPVRGLNIPFTDVALHEGDTVVVERMKPQWISVLGLVNRPGNFPYPPESKYRLADALALAGGLDLVAEPRYVCVYRLRADGEVVGATFQLVDTKNQETLTRQLALKMKPGDVVSVEHTPRTRGNVFFDRVIRITLGLYFDPRDLWESDGE